MSGESTDIISITFVNRGYGARCIAVFKVITRIEFADKSAYIFVARYVTQRIAVDDFVITATIGNTYKSAYAVISDNVAFCITVIKNIFFIDITYEAAHIKCIPKSLFTTLNIIGLGVPNLLSNISLVLK